MNKKLQLILILFILVIAFALIAQNTIEVIPAKPPSITQDSIKPLLPRDINRPGHHFCIPRRRTVISLDRYQENIDLDQKLKTSNEMLYREAK
ncbi:MAG: hypothetical protein P9X26_03580 [Candidatus Stygibacter frigidus]|nr:hypothetical protein [Candidatus Stygibacter frigidus]